MTTVYLHYTGGFGPYLKQFWNVGEVRSRPPRSLETPLVQTGGFSEAWGQDSEAQGTRGSGPGRLGPVTEADRGPGSWGCGSVPSEEFWELGPQDLEGLPLVGKGHSPPSPRT